MLGGLGVIIGCAGRGATGQLREWIRRTRVADRQALWGGYAAARLGPPWHQLEGPEQRPAASQDLVPELQDFASQFLAKEGIAQADASQIWPEPDGPALFTKEFFEAQMDVIIDEKVPVYASGLGSPQPWMERLRASGTKVLCVVGTVRHALQVVPVGIDAVVAQGHDGGGHNSPIGTMALIPQVVDAVGHKVPVIGAGGISDGRGIAAAMMLGASGVWIGSAFLASDEAGIFDGQKQSIVEANEEGTTVSRSVTGKPARMIKSKWTKLWEESENEPLPMPFQGQISRPALTSANLVGRSQDVNPGFAGQGIGMIKAVRPAAEIMADLIEGTETVLAERTAALGL